MIVCTSCCALNQRDFGKCWNCDSALPTGVAATEIEMKEKKARVEDALHATRAAVEEGVVPGGGVALIRAQKALEKLEGVNEDQTVGIRILARSIEEPLRQIVENARGSAEGRRTFARRAGRHGRNGRDGHVRSGNARYCQTLNV